MTIGAELSAIHSVPLADLKPASLNDAVYKPVNSADPAVRELAEQVLKHGLLEPIVVTQDNVIVSGHRRRVACKLAGLETVPVRRMPVRSTDPLFPEPLVAFNTRREKTTAEKVREAVVLTDPNAAHAELQRQRRALSERVNGRVGSAGLSVISAPACRKQSAISDADRPMLAAVKSVLAELEEYWPVTLRQVHYRLLNNPPPRNAKHPDKKYTNDSASYTLRVQE